ncbi:MAG: hypothetical protein KJ600_06930 [Nanoarchaeota archaeon]|nr:hypothetical protein [Nanoarchaeota archaeon]MBU1104258.1 hypothetical protein [Nanoarchaeota archaeon]
MIETFIDRSPEARAGAKSIHEHGRCKLYFILNWAGLCERNSGLFVTVRESKFGGYYAIVHDTPEATIKYLEGLDKYECKSAYTWPMHAHPRPMPSAGTPIPEPVSPV